VWARAPRSRPQGLRAEVICERDFETGVGQSRRLQGEVRIDVGRGVGQLFQGAIMGAARSFDVDLLSALADVGQDADLLGRRVIDFLQGSPSCASARTGARST
jgi:hypothetical protein